MHPSRPMDVPLRSWQLRAIEVYREHQHEEGVLIEATPGAGKTLCALAITHEALCGKVADRIIVVVPTITLKEDWVFAAHAVGLEFNPKFPTDHAAIGPDFHGIVVTYQQLLTNPLVFRALVARSRVFLVLDEPHHAGMRDTTGACDFAAARAWGDIIRTVGEPAARRLLITGTPFRSDDCPLPFVRYEPISDGKVCRPHFRYGYAEALRDGVVRPLYFPSQDGTMEWLSGRNGTRRTASFAEELDRQERSERLRTALDVDKEWIAAVLLTADTNLREVRLHHPDAGGIVFAADIEHAKALAVHTVLAPYDPPVITSDDPDASGKIRRFRNGHQPWVIAVKMISEGVDIPRLRIGVWATPVTSKLFFLQAAGRIVRMVPHVAGHQAAYLYLPDTEPLRSHALRLKEATDHFIRDDQPLPPEGEEKEEKEIIDDRRDSRFLPLSATAGDITTFADGEALPPVELERALQFRADLGPAAVGLHLEQIALALRRYSPPPVAAARQKDKGPVAVQQLKLRKNCHLMAKTLACRHGVEPEVVNAYLVKRTGSTAATSSLAQLEHREQLLVEFLRSATLPSEILTLAAQRTRRQSTTGR